MPRQDRKLQDGGVYHVINRGHNRHKIFRSQCDYSLFKEVIAFYKKRCNFKLYHYCLMPNHFHLILCIQKAKDLPEIMRGISKRYVNYYKRKYRFVGFLFQGRYKSSLIDKDEYLLQCARYVERNPLRAGLVTNIADYPWTSFNYYTRGISDDIIDANILYSTFGKTPSEKQEYYARFILKIHLYEELLERSLGTVI